MPVQAKVVFHVELAGRKGFFGACQEQRELGFFEDIRIFDVEQISKNGGAWVAERVGFGGVSQPLFPSHLFLYEETAFISAQTSPCALIEDARHAFSQLHAFDSADFFTFGAGEHEAPRFGRTRYSRRSAFHTFKLTHSMDGQNP